MSLRSGFIGRSFLFLGPNAVSFGYIDGTDIPYVPGGGTITGPTIVGPSPTTAGAQRYAPQILTAHEKKAKKKRDPSER